QYAYMLEGYDDGWRWVGGQRQATYTSLPPGRYTFRVKAANSDGVWNEEGARLALAVLPPWWRTPLAYVGYVLLFALGVFAVDRVQRRRLIRRERERAEREAEHLRIQAAEARAAMLQVENERKSQELEAARRLQLSMLPTEVPEHPAVAVAAHMQTATEVGGDYYDFHVGEDGTLTLAVGDATGHGAQAGTMVTAAKSLFTTYADEPDPAAVLEEASRALKRMRLPKLYMAFALGKLRGGTLELAGTGMPPALVYRAATGRVEEVPLKGVPLGGPGRHAYPRHRIALRPGDTVALMSDGFAELRAASGRFLGYDRAAAVFGETAAQPPEAVIERFRQEVHAWMDGTPLNDDVTFVVLQARANGQAAG
ncbi:MAG: SpoIIE family protein phosphatase, partial [Rhodothermales bacterium]|nr:SpoIIE family protein phosphatase [Rhodothermales bacterium]